MQRGAQLLYDAPQRSFLYEPLEFQHIFFTLYVTASKLIRHVPPLGARPRSECLDDDDDGPRTCVGGEIKPTLCVKFGCTFSSVCHLYDRN